MSTYLLLWVYLKKVIPETCRVHWIRRLHIYYFECTWRRLFQIRVVYIELDVYIFITLSVPEEGYSRYVSCTLNYMSTYLLLWVYLKKVIPETRCVHWIRCLHIYYLEYTWRRLFQKRVVYIELDVYIFITLSIPEEGYSRNALCTLN